MLHSHALKQLCTYSKLVTTIFLLPSLTTDFLAWDTAPALALTQCTTVQFYLASLVEWYTQKSRGGVLQCERSYAVCSA